MRILRIIQDQFGALNTEEGVTFDDNEEAVIWIKDESGTMKLFANLTNLAAWRDDGSIPTEEVLINEWLRVEHT